MNYTHRHNIANRYRYGMTNTMFCHSSEQEEVRNGGNLVEILVRFG
jgi:hypothetical protein